MIEWDEILEDVNWKRGIAIIIGGIILLAAVVFLGLDWHRYSLNKVLLDNDLEEIQGFQKTWSAPDIKATAKLQNELKEEEAKLAALGVDLPDTIDPASAEAGIRQAADRDRLPITRLNPAEKRDGYCGIYEVEVIFSSKEPARSMAFLSDLGALPGAHSIKSDAVSLQGGTLKVKVEYYYFDRQGWDEVNNCQVKLTIPEIPDRDIAGVYVFGGQLKDLKARVDQENAGLKDVKKQFIEGCELQKKMDEIKAKIKIIQEKLSK